MDNSWEQNYRPTRPSLWNGRKDANAGEYIFQEIQVVDLRQGFEPDSDRLNFALIGFACDEGIRRNFGRTGALEGPILLRSNLGRLPLHCSGRPGIYDLGTIDCVDGDLEKAQEALAALVSRAINSGAIPIVLGGGQEVAWGHYQGLARTGFAEDLAVINFGAGFNLRPTLKNNKGTSATSLLQIANHCDAMDIDFDCTCIGIQPSANSKSLFGTAEGLNVQYASAIELRKEMGNRGIELINEMLKRKTAVYASISLDVFSAALAPGVSSPQPLGASAESILPLLQHLASSGKIIALDLVDLAPRYDHDYITSRLGAHVIWTIIHSMATATAGHV